MDTEAGAKSSLASFLAEMNPAIDALIRGDDGADTHGGMAGIIRHGTHRLDPSDAASKLLSDTKAFPQGPPKELRTALHHLAKKHRRARKQPSLKITQNDLTGMALKSKSEPSDGSSEYISDNAAETPLETTDADIKKAVQQCNDMVYSANEQLETVMFNCWEQGNSTKKQQYTVDTDLNRFIEEITELDAKVVKVNSDMMEAKEELESVKTQNTTETVEYEGKMKQMNEEMGKLRTELAVTKFMLNITRCPDSEYANLDLLQKNSKGSSNIVDNKIEFCQGSGNGSPKLAFLNQRLESASKQLSVQARERLALSLSGVAYGPAGEKLDDGDDDDAEVDQSGQEDVDNVDMGQGIALIQKSGTRQSHSQPEFEMKCTGVCTAADRCSRLEADCAHLYDVFAGIWGEVKDQIERLQEEMEQTTAEYEKRKAYYNREDEILSHEISSLNVILIDTGAEKVKLLSQKRIKEAEQESLKESYKELCDKCLEECSYIAGTLICGPLAVRNELVQHLDVPAGGMEPTDVRDCVMTDFRHEVCSVKCDDSLVGGFKLLERDEMEPPDEEYGLKCPSATREMKCNQFKCPVDCELDDWSEWSECTRECGQGAQTRQRNIKVHPKNGGGCCEALTDVRNCNPEPCDKDCTLLPWTDWGSCSSACGGGVRTRFRDEDPAKPAEGINGGCPDYYDEKRYDPQPCNTEKCVGDEICIAKMDVVLLIDSSGSLSQKGFDILKNLSSKIIDRLKPTAYGDNAVRVGVVQFGNGHLNGSVVSPAKLVQTFSSNFNTTKASIAGMKYQKGFTNMAQGLMRAKDLLAKKGRDNNNATVLMITDGFPSFEYETEQAAQRVRKTANLVIAHVKSNPRPYDVRLMRKYARYVGNYVSIPGKQQLKEDMQTYASESVVKMCPLAESVSKKDDKDKRRGFQKRLQGQWCANPMPDKWFSGYEGSGWSNEMSKETCKAKSEEVSSEWKFFEYTTYPGSTMHECLVYTKECNTDGWSRWTHANIYEKYTPPPQQGFDLFSSIGPNGDLNAAR
jgi:uncharacterized protein YegL